MMIEQKQSLMDSATAWGVYGSGGAAAFFLNLPDHIQFITLLFICVGALFRALYDGVKFWRYVREKTRAKK